MEFDGVNMTNLCPHTHFALLPVFIFNSVLLVCSLPVYTVVLLVLRTYKNKFSAPFFKIFISGGVADISWTVTRLWEPLSLNNMFLNMLNWAAYWFFQSTQVTSVILIGLNRLTAIVFPMRHDSLWSGKLFKLALVFTWLSSVAFALVVVVYMLLLKQLGIITNHKSTVLYVHMLNNTLTLLTIGCLVAMHLAMYLAHRKRNNNQQQQSSDLDAKTALMGVFLSIFYIASCSNTLSSSVQHAMSIENIEVYCWASVFTRQIQPVGRSLFGCSNPFLLLWLSKTVRDHCKKYLKIDKTKPGPATGRRREIAQSNV